MNRKKKLTLLFGKSFLCVIVVPSKIGHLFAEKREIHIEKNVFLKVFKASWVSQGGYYTMQKCFLHFCIV